MTAPVIYTRQSEYLKTFSAQLAERLQVPQHDVAGAIVDLALAGLVEVSLSPEGVIITANPLPEEEDGAQTQAGPGLRR